MIFPHLELDNYAVGIPLVALVVALAILGQVLVKRIVSRESLINCHEVAGYCFSVVGTLYAVILGLVVLDAITKYENAAISIEKEAISLISVYTLADHFKDTDSEAKIQQLSKYYLNEILANDWNLMNEGKKNFKARNILKRLIDTNNAIEPITENQKIILPMLIDKSLSIRESSRARYNQADNGISTVEWIALLVGGLLTIMFTYFFNVDNSKAQYLMTGIVTLVISMNLYIVLLFAEPYTGDFIASRIPLIQAQQIMDETYYGDGWSSENERELSEIRLVP